MQLMGYNVIAEAFAFAVPCKALKGPASAGDHTNAHELHRGLCAYEIQ